MAQQGGNRRARKSGQKMEQRCKLAYEAVLDIAITMLDRQPDALDKEAVVALEKLAAIIERVQKGQKLAEQPQQEAPLLRALAGVLARTEEERQEGG